MDNHAYPIVWRPLVNESSIFATTSRKVDDVVNNKGYLKQVQRENGMIV